MNVVDWAKSHPWETGGAVFLGGLALLYILRAFGGGSSSGGVDPNVAAYLNANAAQAQAGDALQAVQIQAQATTAQTIANDQASIDVNNTWAANGLATTQSNNETAVKTGLIAGLSAVANNLGTTLTSSWNAAWGGGSGGSASFLGFGGSSSSEYSGSKGASSQSFVANSEQGQAVGLLGSIENAQFHAGS